MHTLIEGCAAAGARLVFIDNLYQLGPQTAPRTEDMPLTATRREAGDPGRGDADLAGGAARVPVAALRCSDFYGPGVANSHLGASRSASWRRAGRRSCSCRPTRRTTSPTSPTSHGRLLLLDAPDADFGQAWNVPCAPTRSPRALLTMGAGVIGRRLRLWAVPFALLRPLGLVYRFAREVADVGFTWDRAYVVDGGKFARRFGFAPTPFEVGVPATVRSFATGG